MSDEPKLTAADKRELAIQSGLEAIPYVGGPLATLYFGAKQERRFKRLESFYAQAAEDIRNIEDKVHDIREHDPDALEAIIEELNEKVESEATEKKRRFFRNYFKSTLRQPIKSDYDERRYFLEALASMSLLECELLSFLHQRSAPTKIGSIRKDGVEPYAVVGAISQLRSRGFLGIQNNSITLGRGDNILNDQVAVTEYGRKFIEYCLVEK